MGLSQSPYCSIQSGLLAKRLIIGDRTDEDNPFHWDHIEENLPFSETYKASLPKLKKVRVDGLHGSEIIVYVDDIRDVAATEELAWLTSSRVAKGLCWLGLQDAARKRRRPSQKPGSWVGSVVTTQGGRVTKSVTQERWEKTRNKIRWLAKQAGLEDSFTPNEFPEIDARYKSKREGFIHYKTTEKLVGFIVYVAQTYPSLVPYLKGIYLTLNCWRGGRDKEGWLTPEAKRQMRLGTIKKEEHIPEFVKLVPRFSVDLVALMKLTSMEKPPEVPIRAANDVAVYCIGDASGTGFGSIVWVQGGKRIRAEFRT